LIDDCRLSIDDIRNSKFETRKKRCCYPLGPSFGFRVSIFERVAHTCFLGLRFFLARMRRKHGFAITTWVFLPDHWHAITYPPCPLTISTVFKVIKVRSMIGINIRRRECGKLWQGRFFDRALRTVKEYNERVGYIHLNPVRQDLVIRATDWKWSSVHEYAGVSGEESISQRTACVSTGCACRPMRIPGGEKAPDTFFPPESLWLDFPHA
jgi:REP element-mobilizing transposase RayT